MGIKGVILGLGLTGLIFQVGSLATADVENPPKDITILAEPSFTPTPSPSPTFDKPSLPPLPIEEEPSLTPTTTPSPTPTLTPTPTPTPSPTPTPPQTCIKIHGKQMGKHLGWIMQGRVCIGKRG